MTKRIFHSICMVALAIFLATSALIMTGFYSYFTKTQKNQLKNETILTTHAVANEGLSYFDGMEKTDFRITWIDGNGNILYDSQMGTGLQNHLQREEIQEAILTGHGESVRYSDTMLQATRYCAQKLPDETVLRLSIAQETIFSLILSMGPPIIVVILVTVGLSLLLAARLSRRIVKPLNELNLENPMANAEYEELQPLLKRINTQLRQLRQQEIELQRKQLEFDTVTGSMAEGLVLLNSNGLVLSINEAAANLLGVTPLCNGKDFLSLIQIPEIQQLVRESLFGQHAEKTVQLPAGAYQVDASPVRTENRLSGVALLILDVTEKYQSEQLRREFSANVSHELKTPLHAVSGYAELLKSGLVQPEDVPDFSSKIYSEAQRLIRLVDDIIRLSRLDEGGDTMTWETVDLYILAQDAISTLEDDAKRAQINVTLEGESAVLYGIPQLLSGIITNLCSNAIKYNHQGGSVNVRIANQESSVTLTVQDTGIGIPPEHQPRIFERFYRVDKSHSKAVGGTGLGLSIVKHSAQIHKAKIDLTSVPEEGTTIQIHFPK